MDASARTALAVAVTAVSCIGVTGPLAFLAGSRRRGRRLPQGSTAVHPSTERAEAYRRERELLITAEKGSAESLDKALLTLSAGALGLSITIIREIAPHPRHEAVLVLAWLGFGAALLFTLVSLLFSQYSFQEARKTIDDYYLGTASEERRFWANCTTALTLLSIVTFAGGALAFAGFSFVNLPR